MNTYSVIRSVSNPKSSRLNTEEIVKTGLSWADAWTLRDELQKQERVAHPERTSWTSDIFYCQLEKERRMNYELVFHKIIADPRYAEGITYGKPRRGHQEGTVKEHLAELDANLTRLADIVSTEEYWKLAILIHTHDTFKKWAARDVPIDQHNSHASLAREFLGHYLPDVDLLNMVQFHDENFALWKQMKKNGVYDQERFLKRTVEGIRDIQLFLIFTIIDGYTSSKMALADAEKPEKLRWFYQEVLKHRSPLPRVEMALGVFGL